MKKTKTLLNREGAKDAKESKKNKKRSGLKQEKRL
jgi:hypothetical protein